MSAITVKKILAEPLNKYRIYWKIRLLPATAEFPSGVDLGCYKVGRDDPDKTFYEPVKFRGAKAMKLKQVIEGVVAAMVLLEGSPKAKEYAHQAILDGIDSGIELSKKIKGGKYAV